MTINRGTRHGSTGSRTVRAAVVASLALGLGAYSAPGAAAHGGTHEVTVSPGVAAGTTTSGPYTALGIPSLTGVGYLAVGTTLPSLLEHVRADGRDPATVKIYDQAGRRLDITTGRAVTAAGAAVGDGIRKRLGTAAEKLRKRGCTADEVSVLTVPAGSVQSVARRAGQVLQALEAPYTTGARGPVVDWPSKPGPATVAPSSAGDVDAADLRDCMAGLSPLGHHKRGYLHNVWHRVTGT